MSVRRIVTNLQAEDPAAVADFYREIFDLEAVMDMGWIITLAGKSDAPVQISFASHGGSGTDIPPLSIEVDDVDAIYERAKAKNCPIVHELTDEPWGVRRFFLRDPLGNVVNVLSHGKSDG